MQHKILCCVLAMAGLACAEAQADGRVVDKVYHPYVQPLEREFEYRFIYQKQSEHPDNNAMGQKIGYGFSIAERLALETYLISRTRQSGRLQA